jgi:hypothetical protein
MWIPSRCAQEPGHSRGAHDPPRHPPIPSTAHLRRRALLRADRRTRRPDRPAAPGPGPGGRPGHGRPHPDPARAPARRQVPRSRGRGARRPGPGGLSGSGQGDRRLRPRPGARLSVVRAAHDHRRTEAAPAGPDGPRPAAPVRAGSPATGRTDTAGAGAAVRRPRALAGRDRPRLRPVRGRRDRGRALPGRAAPPLPRRTAGRGRPHRPSRARRNAGRAGRPARSRRRTGRGHQGAAAVPRPGAPHPRPALLPRPDPAADRGGRGALADARLAPAHPVPGTAAAHARGPRPVRHRHGPGEWRRTPPARTSSARRRDRARRPFAERARGSPTPDGRGARPRESMS